MRHCPACSAETPHTERFEKDGFPIVACETCGLGSTVVPFGFDPTAIYSAGYFTGARKGDGYADYPASEPVLRREARQTLRALARHTNGRKGRLVELGAAYGFFLLEARHQFQDCIGVDVSVDAMRYAQSRGLTMYHASDPAWRDRAPFDVAVMLDTIEHLDDPNTVLGTLRQTVRPGGALLLTTGDWASLYARLSGAHWRLMTPPQHLYFYTIPSVTKLLAQLGFRVVSAVHPWKVVPVGLALWQLTGRLGFRLPVVPALNRIGLHVNLFDAMRVIAVRE